MTTGSTGLDRGRVDRLRAPLVSLQEKSSFPVSCLPKPLRLGQVSQNAVYGKHLSEKRLLGQVVLPHQIGHNISYRWTKEYLILLGTHEGVLR